LAERPDGVPFFHKEWAAMTGSKSKREKTRSLIFEYEWLRQQAKVLDWQASQLDARLIEIEKHLPANYQFPDDPPLSACRNMP
jgi:hypothetical protein